MKNITNSIEVIRSTNGGATVYSCPWNDYRSTSFWKNRPTASSLSSDTTVHCTTR